MKPRAAQVITFGHPHPGSHRMRRRRTTAINDRDAVPPKRAPALDAPTRAALAAR